MKITEAVLKEMREVLSEHISGHRLEHSLSVEGEAQMLASLYGMSEEETMKLRAAAILHDVTKAKSTEEQLALCKEFGIELSEDDKRSPKVLHSVTGAEMARRLFPDYVDDEICDQIRYHTTGRKGMTLGEKLLYLADYIEPTRTYGECMHLRGLFYEADTLPTEKHLNKILLYSFDTTLRVLLEEKLYIHTRTVETRNGILADIARLDKSFGYNI